MSLSNIANRFYHKLAQSKSESFESLTKCEIESKKLKSLRNVNKNLENLFFWSEERLLAKQRSKIRRKLARIYFQYKFIAWEQISTVVKDFLKDLKTEEKNSLPVDEFQLMPPPFICKCGWLFLNPSTLPCGHTMCKHCIDEAMFCTECGYTLENPSNTNKFLIDIISHWFGNEYKATKLKKKAHDYLLAKKLEEALQNINESLYIVPEDHTAFYIRSKIYSELQEHKDALRDSELACKLNPTVQKIQFQRGECYAKLGDFNNAIDTFQLCLELEPDNMALSNTVMSSIDALMLASDVNSKTLKELDYLEETVESNSNEKGFPINDKEMQAKSVLVCNLSTEHSKSLTQREPIVDLPDLFSQSFINKEHDDVYDNLKDNILMNSCSLHYDKDSSELSKVVKSNKINADYKECSSSSELVCHQSHEKIHCVSKEEIKEDDFECKLCYELLYKPVTTPCGHVFCKHCLLRTMDHNPNCPICRVSLQDYQAKSDKPVTVTIVKILELYFKYQLAEREKVYNLRLERLSRVGVDPEVEIPVMVCSIAFPYVSCPLHIFEPKYRLMIRDCLESGSRKFGMCIPKSGRSSENEFSEIGTIVEIIRYQCLPDGRFVIHTVAGQRFTVLSKMVKESLFYAKVIYFCDQDEKVNQAEFAVLSRQIYNQLSGYISSLKSAEQDCIFNALGPLPRHEDNFSNFQHGLPWVWWGLAAIPLNLTAKLVLLRTKSLTERMHSLRRFLGFLTRLNQKK